MFNKITLLAVYPVIALLLMAGCTMNPPVQGSGQEHLQGEWRQDSIPGEKKLLTYSLSNFKFTCDSFYIAINTLSRVNSGADSCMNKGRWIEYIKGRYEQTGDTLHLRGVFTNADGSLKDNKGCFRFGPYESFYNIKTQGDSLIILNNSSTVIPIQAKLIRRVTCSPKPLAY
ncbi:fumarate hydratase [Mucilaginibacter sp. UR6-1]|uniref:fumarate hydratase n=1 Tax=Mucilaginibacter sp. UR6-1 TaxID=1435643 RepID=UPI001E570286|nr:fumarate hydratase [Mucilaginibacter sp. UR6-1]MCC8411080.1 fumarate hydratase [Mucilaginibacter sp. UR6-1]